MYFFIVIGADFLRRRRRRQRCRVGLRPAGRRSLPQQCRVANVSVYIQNTTLTHREKKIAIRTFVNASTRFSMQVLCRMLLSRLTGREIGGRLHGTRATVKPLYKKKLKIGLSKRPTRVHNLLMVIYGVYNTRVTKRTRFLASHGQVLLQLFCVHNEALFSIGYRPTRVYN